MENLAFGRDVQDGFWGPRTAAVDWCENNYQESFYIAEFWNCTSSLVLSLAGILFLHYCFQYAYDKRFFYSAAVLVFVGLGSAMFHGTLLYVGQVLDELPMVYLATMFLYCILVVDGLKTRSVGKDIPFLQDYWVLCLVMYLVAFTGVYLFTPAYFVFFLSMFSAGVLYLLYRCFKIAQAPATPDIEFKILLTATCFFIGGFLLFWIPDIVFCSSIQHLKLHAVFHVTSAIGSYLWLIFCCFETERLKGRSPKISYEWGLIPYVNAHMGKI